MAEGYSINDFTFKVGDEVLTPVANGSMYYVEVKNIASKDLDTMYEVTINDTLSVQYAAMTYVQSMLNKADAKAELVTLSKAIYLYNQAANEYFAK